jgi:hypothetical protein
MNSSSVRARKRKKFEIHTQIKNSTINQNKTTIIREAAFT